MAVANVMVDAALDIGGGAAAESQHHDASRTVAVYKLCMSPDYLLYNVMCDVLYNV